jgi:hypothetical protein
LVTFLTLIKEEISINEEGIRILQIKQVAALENYMRFCM